MPLRRTCYLNRLYHFTLLINDFLIIALSILFAILIRFGSLDTAAVPFSAIAGTWIFLVTAEILAMMVEDLYVIRTTVNKTMNIFRTIRTVITISVFFIVVLFLAHFPTNIFICSRLSIFTLMMLWLTMTIINRLLIIPRIFLCLLRILRFGKITVVIFGTNTVCKKIRSTLLKSTVYQRLFEFKVYSQPLPDNPYDRYTRCMEILKNECATELIMVFEDEDFDSIAQFSLLVRRAGIPFSIYSRRMLKLGYFDPWITINRYAALTFCSRKRTGTANALWRASDILIALTGLLVFLPFVAVIVPAIAFTSPGGIIFKQTRIGYRQKPFSFLKFRSMRVDVDDRKSVHKKYFMKYVNGNAAAKSESGEVFKTISSKAVTPIGRIIRKTSMDEIPQILNVLRGEMSIVGPRPCIDYEMEHYTSEWLQERFTIKPGLTGIWQIYGRSRLDFKKSQFLDFIYVLSRTDGKNIRLILKTFPVIFFGKGGL